MPASIEAASDVFSDYLNVALSLILNYSNMLKTKIKVFFLILLVSVGMLLLVSFLTSKIQYNTALSFTGYFFLTLISIKFFSKKLSASSIIWIIFATMIVLQSFTIYTWFVWDTFGLPVVAATCFAVISAFLTSQMEISAKYCACFFEQSVLWLLCFFRGGITGFTELILGLLPVGSRRSIYRRIRRD